VEFNPFSADFFDDPYPTYRWLRDHAPVYRSERNGYWALSRYADVVAAHRDWRTFSNAHGVTLADIQSGARTTPGNILVMDPPDHERLRKLTSKVFTPRAIAALEPMIRDVERSFLDPLMGRDEIDAVADFAAPFPVEVISAMLGVPKPDRQRVRERTDLILHREANDANPTPAGMAAGAEQARYFLDLIQDKRRHLADDMISHLCQVELDDAQGPARLSDVEIAGFVSLLAAAGSETVTKLIGSGVVLFARNPGEWRKVLQAPSCLTDAVEEILRYWAPSQYQGRFSHAESSFEGGTIPANVPVLLLTGAASRDERAYPEPDRFDVGRAQQIAIGFGYGIHSCLGAALARLESRIAFEEIVARWPGYAVKEEGLRRVHMAHVAGFSHVPIALRPS